jgi:hypothetical protein
MFATNYEEVRNVSSFFISHIWVVTSAAFFCCADVSNFSEHGAGDVDKCFRAIRHRALISGVGKKLFDYAGRRRQTLGLFRHAMSS